NIGNGGKGDEVAIGQIGLDVHVTVSGGGKRGDGSAKAGDGASPLAIGQAKARDVTGIDVGREEHGMAHGQGSNMHVWRDDVAHWLAAAVKTLNAGGRFAGHIKDTGGVYRHP